MGQYYNILLKEGRKINTYNRQVVGDTYTGAKLTEHSWWKNPFVCSIVRKIYNNPCKIAWVGDYADKGLYKGNNLHNLAWEKKKEDMITIDDDELYLDNKVLVNHTQKIFVDCNKYKCHCMTADGWCLHLLPLLTAYGNGRGCGDYYGSNINEIGLWCWELISVEDAPPKNYEEVEYVFIESA